ncbi:stage II sporulation protein M [Ohtaekwangia koreensis]|uniref:Uncharacterized membrane protein SpoIIM, required for sporulation n=1 Tax=Ohtaekwangia koreensis TaxID=688867 RepID=A0A1T5J542_9BACT|nr:stage II sporulation protein M [Ohtaekwangia koreensis]SKC46549.1 Uncharacterized membrane protein SpoIIM, required for sporulation [Ohtaekwangia koreensis]
MKETRFIAQNKEKWLESETLLTSPVKDPEKLSNLFTQVVDDLSFSRTYYKNRSVRVYLNKIAREYFSIIYNLRKEKKNHFKLFWLDELPQIILYCKKQLLISFIVFVLASCIGVFSSYKDPQFATTILGESYVAMTKENIEKGDPMAVYKKGHQVDMFLGITLNNLMVAFRTYVFGIFLAIGSLAILLYNGIMVGCFQFFFIERGLLAESALTIWLHGTLEISSIILAGGAGLTLGSGLVFPGTYSRLQSFQISAMRSLKLMLGISPIFVLAAIIESFLTRYTEVPDAVRLILILLSALLIIGYFVIYPWRKSKRGFEIPLIEVRLPPTLREAIYYDRIKNNAEILKDAFLFYTRNANKLLSWILVITLAMTTADFVLEGQITFGLYIDQWWQNIVADMFYALKTPSSIFILINTLGTSLILYRILMIADAESKKAKPKLVWTTLIKTILITSLIYTAIYLGEWGILFLFLSYGMFLLYTFSQLTEQSNLLDAFAQTWTLIRTNFGQVMGLQLILMLMSFSFLLVLSAPLIYMYTTILQWNFAETDVWSRGIVHFIELFIKTFAFNLIIPILAASVVYLYFSLKETDSAESLKKAIAMVGSKFSKTSKR